MVIALKSNTAIPFATVPVRDVPPGPVSVGVPLVLIVYVPVAVENAPDPDKGKSSGLSGPAPARSATPTSRTRIATPRTARGIPCLIARSFDARVPDSGCRQTLAPRPPRCNNQNVMSKSL
jgi:hypothetical protein